jgi:opacity protein-like surface antigen
MEICVKKLSFAVAALCLLMFVAAGAAHAQQVDLAFGYGTVTGNPASDGDGINHQNQSISGGGYPAFSGDFLFKKNFGIGGEVAWRAHQNVDDFFQPYRPILYDINAVYGPQLGKRAQLDLQGGIGLESLRFYQQFFTCSSFGGCTNFNSSNHFLTHVGAGIRLYVTNNIFIRPEAHFYFVNNNLEFAGPRVNRYGVSIGYSLKNKE